MKHLLFAAGFALIIHGLLLGLKIDWPQDITQPVKKPEPLSLTLSYIYPEKPVVLEPAAPPIINKTPEKKPDKKNIIKPRKKNIKKSPVIIKEPELIKPDPKEPPPANPTTPAPDIPIEISVQETDPLPVPQTEIAEENNQDINNTAPVAAIKQEIPVLLPSPPPLRLREAYPVYNSNPAPEYPRTARRRGYEGIVILDVFVDKTGKVRELNISKSSGHKILDNAAKISVKDWLFEPGKRGDEKIEMRVKVPIRFELN